MTAETYVGKYITVINRGERCIHSRHCVLDRPEVFVPNAEGAWIRPDEAQVDAVVAVIERCPSGALSYQREAGAVEQPPGVNHVRLQENGPLAFSANLRLAGEPDAGYRAMLCRCGQSNNKPYCDNSHRAADFKATGEPTEKPSEPQAVRNGPVSVTPTANGPLLIDGPLELCAASGRTLDRVQRTALCRCGASNSKPYCDGSHVRIGFVASAP